MSMPGFTAGVSLYHSRHHYRVHDQYARSGTDTVVPAQRCPFPCYEANVACIPMSQCCSTRAGVQEMVTTAQKAVGGWPGYALVGGNLGANPDKRVHSKSF